MFESIQALAAHGARLLGSAVVDVEGVSGASLSQIVLVTMTDGRRAIVKGGPAPRTEAVMLEQLAARGAPAPQVLGVDDDALVLQALRSDGQPAEAWAQLGAVVARLHEPTKGRFGWADDYAFGDVHIDNTWSADWPAFWAERRLAPHLRYMPMPLARRLEALLEDLPARLPRAPPASLLHGDLWGGNVLVGGGRVTGLVDPACYYGHCEVDLAMLTLFDSPDARFFDAYGRLEPGYRERRRLYQLWPALVHLRLFGAAYCGLLERLLAGSGV